MTKPDTGFVYCETLCLSETLSLSWRIEGRLPGGVINQHSSSPSLPECLPYFSAGRLIAALRPTSNVTFSEKPFLNLIGRMHPSLLGVPKPLSPTILQHFSHIIVVNRSCAYLPCSLLSQIVNFPRTGSTLRLYQSIKHLPLPGTRWTGRPLYLLQLAGDLLNITGSLAQSPVVHLQVPSLCQLGGRTQELPASISEKMFTDSVQSNRYILRTSSHKNKNKNLATATRISTPEYVRQVLYIHNLIV